MYHISPQKKSANRRLGSGKIPSNPLATLLATHTIKTEGELFSPWKKRTFGKRLAPIAAGFVLAFVPCAWYAFSPAAFPHWLSPEDLPSEHRVTHPEVTLELQPVEGWEGDESLFLPVTMTNTMEQALGFGPYCRAEHLYQGKRQAVYGSRPRPALVNTLSAMGSATASILCPLAWAFFFPFFFPLPPHIE